MPGVESSRVFTSCAMRLDSSRSWPRISTARRPPPWLPMPRIMFWPPEARARTMTPGRPDSWRRSSIGDLLVAPRALGLGHQTHLDAAAVGGRVAEAAAATRLGDQHGRLRDGLANAVLELDQHRFGVLDAGADGEFGIDRHFALVGGRLELEADARQQEQRHQEQAEAGREHRRPVVQRQVQRASVERVDAFERRDPRPG